MAIAYDAFTLIGTPATGSISGTHTPVGTPKGATIWVVSSFGSSTAADEISTCTYGGVSCTEVTGSPNTHNPGGADNSVVHCFHLGSGIPTGAQTVAVTATASVGINAVYCVTTTASANTEVVDTTVITGIASNPSGTLSLGGVSCFCAQGWFSGLNAPGNTPLTGWTERQEYDLGTNEAGLTTYNTVSTADVTFGNTCAADEFNYIAIAIRESAGGGVDVAATPATATASGTSAAFNVATGILASPSIADASGVTANFNIATGIDTVPATATASGINADIDVGGEVNVDVSPTTATASGVSALIRTDTGIIAVPGEADASGVFALIEVGEIVETPVGGGIGHGGKRRPHRIIHIEEAERPEEVIAEIEARYAQAAKKPIKKVTPRPTPSQPQAEAPQQWLDYYDAQTAFRVKGQAEREAMNDLIAQARMKIRALQEMETLARMEELEFMRQEEEVLLLLMAA